MTRSSPARTDADAHAPQALSFGRRFTRLFGAGLLGIAALPPALAPMVRAQQAAGTLPPDLSLEVAVALSLINPTLLLAISAAVGARLAPKLGFASLIAGESGEHNATAPLGAVAGRAVVLGLLAGGLIVALDGLFRPYLSPAWHEAAAKVAQPGSVGSLVSGLLYGGITEEILLRWGVLSFLAWALWRLVQRGAARPSPLVVWSALALAALLFGLGHLPAVAALSPLDGPLVMRTIVLNALPGLCFGWLFVRHHLEAAMLAHASAHVAMALAAWLGAA
jgi:hypothetical protein